MNLPNILTILRIILTFVFAFLVLREGFSYKVLAAAVFTAASLTDFLDGYLAKKNNIVTNFGKIMDPIADKVLILTTVFIFSRMGLIPFWMFGLMAFREIGITLFRMVAISKKVFLPAESAGKLKTVIQIVAISITLIFLCIYESPLSLQWLPTSTFHWIALINIVMFLAVVLTIYSGAIYFWNNRKVLHVSSSC